VEFLPDDGHAVPIESGDAGALLARRRLDQDEIDTLIAG
jgi:hypothetical protein